MKREVVPSFDDYTFLNRWALTFIGMWDYGTVGRFARIRRRIHHGVLILMLMLLLVPQWLDLYVFWGNFEANAETLILHVFTIAAFSKLVSCIDTTDILHDLVSTLKQNWMEAMNGTEPEHRVHKEILLKTATRAFNFTKQYAILMYATATLYYISPFVGMQRDNLRIRKYPFFGWYYFDKFSDFYYGLCYASQMMIGTVVGTTNFAMDSIFLVTVYHCSAQLKILQHDAMRIGSTDDSSEKITRLIRKHLREIRNSRKLQAIFSGTSFQQLLVSCLIICVIGLKLIIALEDGGYEFLVYLAFLVLALLQILSYCEPGDELLSESLDIGHALYQSSWTSLDLSSMRKVLLMILRSQKPIKICAGKIYVLSLQNFTMVIKYNELNIMLRSYIRS